MAAEVRWAFLLPADFERRLKEAPIAYIPAGSLEYHGDHLALGNDSLKMEAECVEAAKISGGVVFPPVFAGTGGLTRFPIRYKFEGGVAFPEELMRTYLLSLLERIERSGFKVAILITGHTSRGQSLLMDAVAKEYNRRRGMLVVAARDSDFAHSMGHFSDHAAKWETSILWHFYPRLVDLTRLPKDLSIQPEKVGGLDPRLHASPGLGKAVSEKVAKELAMLALRALKRAERLRLGPDGRYFSERPRKRNLVVPRSGALASGRKFLNVASRFYKMGEEVGQAEFRTQVTLTYDAKVLLFDFLAESTADPPADCLEIFIAPDAATPKRFFHIGFTPKGKVLFRQGGDLKGFSARGRRISSGWRTRAKLPAAALGLSTLKRGMTFLANFCRTSHTGENSSWNKCFGSFDETEAFGKVRLA